jgi:hypothetical protein
MTVPPPERDRRWDYRRDAIQRVEDAVRKMIVDKSRKNSEPDHAISRQPVQELEAGKCSPV